MKINSEIILVHITNSKFILADRFGPSVTIEKKLKFLSQNLKNEE